MKDKCFLVLVGVVAFATAGVASDITDYLPAYDIQQSKFAPLGTRSIVEDKRDSEDYRSQRDYNERGQLTAVYMAGWNVGWGSVERFTWSDEGRLLSSHMESHGSDVSFNHVTTTYTTDNHGLVTGYKKVNYFSAPPEIDHVKLNETECVYTYDNQGNCTKVTITDDGRDFDFSTMNAGNANPTVTVISYEYDPNGNLIKGVKTIDGKEVSSQTFEYSKGNGRNLLKRSVYSRPRYDNNGICTITTRFGHFGEEVPSGYLMGISYENFDDDYDPGKKTDIILFNGLPLSETEANPNIPDFLLPANEK